VKGVAERRKGLLVPDARTIEGIAEDGYQDHGNRETSSEKQAGDISPTCSHAPEGTH
jgi:hypothetical protein